jgi:hypothetical protein
MSNKEIIPKQHSHAGQKPRAPGECDRTLCCSVKRMLSINRMQTQSTQKVLPTQLLLGAKGTLKGEPKIGEHREVPGARS